MSTKTQFITDEHGARTAVILPLPEYETLLEDLEDLKTVAERSQEPTVPLEEVLANLRNDGLLPR